MTFSLGDLFLGISVYGPEVGVDEAMEMLRGPSNVPVRLMISPLLREYNGGFSSQKIIQTSENAQHRVQPPSGAFYIEIPGSKYCELQLDSTSKYYEGFGPKIVTIFDHEVILARDKLDRIE